MKFSNWSQKKNLYIIRRQKKFVLNSYLKKRNNQIEVNHILNRGLPKLISSIFEKIIDFNWHSQKTKRVLSFKKRRKKVSNHLIVKCFEFYDKIQNKEFLQIYIYSKLYYFREVLLTCFLCYSWDIIIAWVVRSFIFASLFKFSFLQS